MERLRVFIRTSLFGGVAVILPAAISLFIFKWLFELITDIIQPMTNLLMERSHLQELVADILVIVIILGTCFLVGIVVKTKVGRFIHENLEKRILTIAPGYSLIKETVMQFMGKKKSPFSSVALVHVFENSTLMTAFVTDTHEDGSCTVFVPTGPNPTSGNIYHLGEQYVHHVNIPVEEAMRSIISCGAGSTGLMAAYGDKTQKGAV